MRQSVSQASTVMVGVTLHRAAGHGGSRYVACCVPEGRLMAKQRPTRRQLEVLRAYIRAGSVAAAAYELGISESTARQHLSGLYRRLGCENAVQAAYRLGASDGRAA